ncbi:hypothetical protein AURDEDRAFT_183541 [Auricularia subglabra TFB-10046 SS5]|nr:hypothetical protein AURDEDRAFT_183541 [Auricularia subglabra TFB-10046 SS5]
MVLVLSPQQQKGIREYVLGILQTSLADIIGTTEPSAGYGEDPVVALATAVRSAVDAGISRFLEMQNESRGHALTHLLPELATESFRYLTFRELITVTHVSCAWRRTALADCGLWNSLQLGRIRPCNLEMLEALLARSGRMPFEFTWSSVGADRIPDELLDVLFRNMDRMGALCLYNHIPRDATFRLLEHNAPWLRQLVIREKTTAFLSVDWGTQRVPRLEMLQLGSLSIPADFHPLSALTLFRGGLAKGSSTPVLSRVFPCLTQLDLHDVTQESLQDFGPPPPSCRKIWLSPGHTGDLDYTHFLQSCYNLRLQFIWISGARFLIPSILEFVHVTVAQYRVFILHENALRLECDEEGINREIWMEGVFQVILDEPACFARLDRLGELCLPLGFLLDIHRMQSRTTTPFHSLRSLSIAVTTDSIPPLPHLRAGEEPPLRMPRLDAVTLEVGAMDYNDDSESASANVRWITAEFPSTLPVLISWDVPCLTTLAVVLIDEFDAAHFALRQDLSALRNITQTLRIRDQESTYVKDFVDA